MSVFAAAVLLPVVLFSMVLSACSKSSDASKTNPSDVPVASEFPATTKAPTASELPAATEAPASSEPSTSPALSESPVVTDAPENGGASYASDNDTSQNNNEEETQNLLSSEELTAMYMPNEIIDIDSWGMEEVKNMFYAEEISEEIKARITGKSYPVDCPLSLGELRYVRVLHKGFDGLTHVGEIIVNKLIAEDICEIFYKLFLAEYPIEKMMLVDEFNADDELSMAANNTSAFNFRYILGTTTLSKHSKGLAIDINPLYNPCVFTNSEGKQIIQPASGADYIDRKLENPYYITVEDDCYNLFIGHGFTWGGDWTSKKDYQHFEFTEY